jgi:hypothetical protein
MLKEADWLVDFTSELTSVATREHIPRSQLQRRLLLVLYALGTNLGIEAVVSGGDHRETEAALRRVRRMFITRDNPRAAVVKVAKAKGRLRGKQPNLKPAQEAHWSNSGAPESTPAPSWQSSSPSWLHRLPRRATSRRTEAGPGPARVSSHVFVDESKEREYLLIASVHVSAELDDLRKLMRGLVLRGQRRGQMKKESDPRRRAIAAAICGAGVTATVYDAGQGYRDELDARAACLRGLVEDAAGRGDTLLVIEQDDSLLDWDLGRS